MSGFSNVVQITTLDDYIAPSQECVVKPIGNAKQSIAQRKKSELDANSDPVSITLNDCLACSGCITTAESVLVSQHSHAELEKVLQRVKELDQEMTFVVSISPQSIASIAASYGMNMTSTSRLLTSFFRSIGFSYVFDTNVAAEISLNESVREFTSRLESSSNLPLLCSACPGWICYAEKTHGDWILPYVSAVKSPQQVAGALVKDLLTKRLGVTADRVYHVTIMSCYDKKLEATRKDFYRGADAKDVDMVLATTEVDAMLREAGHILDGLGEVPHANDSQSPRQANHTEFSAQGTCRTDCNCALQTLVEQAIDERTMEDRNFDQIINGSAPYELYAHSGGVSGGYLEFLYRATARKLYGIDVADIPYKVNPKNPDLREATLAHPSDASVPSLVFATAYGFRNIQNIVQKLKRKKSPYCYVEVMACPSGCLNGGGQLRSANNDAPSNRRLLSRVVDVFGTLPLTPTLRGNMDAIYAEWFGSDDSYDDTKRESELSTRYHAVEAAAKTMNINW